MSGLSSHRPATARVPAALALAALVFATACGSVNASGDVDYSVSAKKNYDQGLERLEDEEWTAAAKYFRFVKARFPYSRYAVLAELRLADAQFGAGNHLKAIDSYKLFKKFHPTHEMVANGYVPFRIGYSYVKMLPENWWLLPPAHEKDQSATMDAHRELGRFVRKYPDSSYRERAEGLLQKVDRRLAKHEWYVARFYWERDEPMGTVFRLRRLLERHAGAGLDGDALWLLGQAYTKVGMDERAQKAWRRLIENHPEHDKASEARARLAGSTG